MLLPSNYRPHSSFSKFTNFLSSEEIHLRTTLCISLSCFLYCLQPGTVLQSFYDFHDISTCRISPKLGQSEVASSIFMLSIFGKNITEGTLCLYHCILSGGTMFRFIPLLIMLLLIIWLSFYLPIFPHCKATAFPFVVDNTYF